MLEKVKSKKGIAIIVGVLIAILALAIILLNINAANVAKEVDSKILAIGDVTLDNEKSITDAHKAYVDASNLAKKKMKETKTLATAEKELQSLKDSVESVKSLIDKIGFDDTKEFDSESLSVKNISADSEKPITDAREAYDKLTEISKKYVENYKVLESSEVTYSSLRKSLDVYESISNFATITLDSEETIVGVRTVYDSLTDEEKTYVVNYESLTNAEAELQAIKDENARVQNQKAQEEAKSKETVASTNSSSNKKTSSSSGSSSNQSNQSSGSSSNVTTSNSEQIDNEGYPDWYDAELADPNYCNTIDNDTNYDMSPLNRHIQSGLKISCGDSPHNEFGYSIVNSIYGYKSYTFMLSCQEDVDTAAQVLTEAGY